MKTTNETTANNELTIEQLKSIALKQHLGEDYFVLDGKVYGGTEDGAKEQFNESLTEFIGANEDETTDFATWCDENLTEVAEYDDSDYNNDYLVLTDEEADEKAKQYILDSVWAFNPSFLSSFTGFDIEVFEAIQNNGRCESNNDAILSMIKDEDDFVSDAISADGRGLFLSSYDGCENEETVNGTIFYIYRQN